MKSKKSGLQRKKITKQTKKSTKKTKKQQKQTPPQESQDSNLENSQSNNSEEQESSSSPQNFEPAIKQMTFRSRRGENISTLMRKEIQANKDEDDMYQKYFGKAFGEEDDVDDNESFSIDEKDEKADSFDSDFGKDDDEEGQAEETESKSETSEQKIVKHPKESVQIEEDEVKVTKKAKKFTNHMSLDQLMHKKEEKNDTNAEDAISSVKSSQEQKKFYIHEFFTQEELLKEAVETECKNKESLDLLVKIEQEKRKINLTGRRVILGPYVKQTIRVFDNKEETDFVDRPYLKTQSQIQYLNVCNDFEIIYKFPDSQDLKFIENEQKQKKYPKKKLYKYFDPKTNKGYNNIEEFKHQRKILGIQVETQ